MRNSREEINAVLSDVLEHSVLDTLHSTLHLAAMTLIEVYPLPDEDLIGKGEYHAAHAYSRALINQIEALRDTLRHYRLCLEAGNEGPPDDDPPLEIPNDIPF